MLHRSIWAQMDVHPTYIPVMANSVSPYLVVTLVLSGEAVNPSIRMDTYALVSEKDGELCLPTIVPQNMVLSCYQGQAQFEMERTSFRKSHDRYVIGSTSACTISHQRIKLSVNIVPRHIWCMAFAQSRRTHKEAVWRCEVYAPSISNVNWYFSGSGGLLPEWCRTHAEEDGGALTSVHNNQHQMIMVDMFMEYGFLRAFLTEGAHLLSGIKEGDDPAGIAETALENVRRWTTAHESLPSLASKMKHTPSPPYTVYWRTLGRRIRTLIKIC